MKREWFRKNWPGFLKCGLGLLIALGIFYVFVILYKENNWVAISALATLVLAFVASWSIRQTRDMQKSEKRERLLNEIIDWAVGIRECSFSSINLTALSSVTDSTKVWSFAYASIGNLDLSLGKMKLRSQYISQVALIFPKDLQIAVKELTNNLAEYRKLVSECANTALDATHSKLSKFNSAADKVLAYELLLGRSVNKAIEEGTKIKTKDIG